MAQVGEFWKIGLEHSSCRQSWRDRNTLSLHVSEGGVGRGDAAIIGTEGRRANCDSRGSRASGGTGFENGGGATTATLAGVVARLAAALAERRGELAAEAALPAATAGNRTEAGGDAAPVAAMVVAGAGATAAGAAVSTAGRAAGATRTTGAGLLAAGTGLAAATSVLPLLPIMVNAISPATTSAPTPAKTAIGGFLAPTALSPAGLSPDARFAFTADVAVPVLVLDGGWRSGATVGLTLVPGSARTVGGQFFGGTVTVSPSGRRDTSKGLVWRWPGR